MKTHLYLDSGIFSLGSSALHLTIFSVFSLDVTLHHAPHPAAYLHLPALYVIAVPQRLPLWPCFPSAVQSLPRHRVSVLVSLPQLNLDSSLPAHIRSRHTTLT